VISNGYVMAQKRAKRYKNLEKKKGEFFERWDVFASKGLPTILSRKVKLAR